MNKLIDHNHELVQHYFSDNTRKIQLKTNEVLLRQGETNERIFYVKSGKLCGFMPDHHITEPVFEAHEGSLVGVYSYLSENHNSYSKVVATEPSEVYYYDGKPALLHEPGHQQLMKFLFNIVVLELRSRQHFAAQMANERQDVMNKLVKTEKLSTLGQLSAGLAHELNNAIGSLSGNLRQLEDEVSRLLKRAKLGAMQQFFERGLHEGQKLSSSEARKQRNTWPDKFELKNQTIKILTKAGISPKEVNSKEEARTAAELWNLGNILHDMNIASTQASHVISSIKSMGVAKQQWSDAVDVNRTIYEALAILRSMTKSIHLELDLPESISTIEACHGELVQVWINIIKNAIESLLQEQVAEPKVKVSSRETENEVIVSIEDNGVGIDEAIIERIYEPNFTTKVEGLSLGLGLGLTIVQRIVAEHDGEIKVESTSDYTCFTVILNKKSKRKK